MLHPLFELSVITFTATFLRRVRMLALALLLTISWSASATDTTPPPAPTNLSVLQLGPTHNRVAMSWNSVTDTGGSGLKEYILYRDGLEVARNTSAIGVDTYLLASHTYSFTVRAVDNAGNISTSSTPRLVTSLPLTPVLGPKSVKVLLLRFPDFPGEPFTTNYANNLVFNSPFSVNAFFQEVSWGKVRLVGDSIGWFTLPKYGSNYCTFTLNGGLWYGCDTSQMLADARTVIPSSINYETNDIVILAIHGMGIVGLSGGKYKFVSATNGFSVSVIAHEIGHDFNGVLHAAGLDFCSTYPMGPDLLNLSSNGCFLGRYTDSYDTMAAGNSYHFNMFIKEKMGWVNSNQVQVVTNDGDYVLHQVEIVTNQVQVLKIPLANESFYFLEYRTRTGFNGTNTPTPGVTPIDGVLLHLRPSRFPGTDADTVRPAITLNPGVPFIDPYRGFRAEITQKLTNRVVVRITGLNRPLQITDFARTGGNSTNARVQFNSVDGAKYLVETSSNLQSWVAFKTNILATAASTTNTVTNAASPPQNFFRIGVQR